MTIRALAGVAQLVFLGEANALGLPPAALIPFFDTLNDELTFQLRDRTLYASAITSRVRTQEEFCELRTRGLSRVYISLENGSEDLLRFLNKRASNANAVRLVSAIKTGISVGVMILLGGGGELFFKDHVSRTAAVVNFFCERAT